MLLCITPDAPWPSCAHLSVGRLSVRRRLSVRLGPADVEDLAQRTAWRRWHLTGAIAESQDDLRVTPARARVAHHLAQIDGLRGVRKDSSREAAHGRREEHALQCHACAKPVVGLVASGEEHGKQAFGL